MDKGPGISRGTHMKLKWFLHCISERSSMQLFIAYYYGDRLIIVAQQFLLMSALVASVLLPDISFFFRFQDFLQPSCFISDDYWWACASLSLSSFQFLVSVWCKINVGYSVLANGQTDIPIAVAPCRLSKRIHESLSSVRRVAL